MAGRHPVLCFMQKVNTNSIDETEWKSPKGKFHQFYRGVSEALGRDPQSLDLGKRHPFDLEIGRLPPGAAACPFHSHSAQWELYLIISGRGLVREDTGHTEVDPGDAFLFRPSEAHSISNPGTEDLVYHVIADNPFGDCAYYPDSGKWLVSRSTERIIVRGQETAYLDGEE